MKSIKLYRLFLCFCLCSFALPAFCQLTVTPSQPAAVLAAKLAGPGITISGATLTCAGVANGIFVSSATPLTIDSGIILTTGKSVQASGPESFLASTSNGTAGDASLATLAMSTTYDACVLQFDFIPNGDTVSFNYQFGSEEYNNSTCGPYNDAFAFFISGPGITGTQNMALIPGTTIPVTVNSINSGIPGSAAAPYFCNIANCNSMGPGSPFTSYYYDNTGGTQLTYKGFTTKLAAVHDVIPCSTYHLKIAIADANNALYDSGVFIEAGSLKTNSFHFSTTDSVGYTIGGISHTIVKGCAPANITVLSAHPNGSNQTVHFSFGGTAVQNTDYTAPDSAVIIAGDTSVMISVAGLPTPPAGTTTLELYLLSPFSCGITDSITINILDTPSAYILTPDTTVCSGASFQVRVAGTAGLAYNWSPAAGLSSAAAMQPVATPAATTDYVMTATLPNSGCTAISRDVNVTVINTTIAILTPDTNICLGTSVPISVSGSPALNYSWSPAAGLSSPVIQNPVATPAVTTTYLLTATGAGGACPSTASVTLTVSTLNLSILTPDTTICIGASFPVRVSGTATGPTYSWSPSAGLNDPAVMQPVAAPAVTTHYVLTGSWPGSGCPDVTDSFAVTVINSAITMLTPDTTICFGSAVNIRLDGVAANSYNWSPGTNLNDPAIQDPIATPAATMAYTVTAISPGGLCTTHATLNITVADPRAAILTNDTTICAGSSLTLLVKGDSAQIYTWSPATGLSDPNVMEPEASPSVRTTYILTSSIPGTSCTATQQVTIDVKSAALSDVTLNQVIRYGSSVQLNAGGFLYYMWTPDDGSLSNPDINNPVAAPLAATTYTVNATDIHGCHASASVTIDLTYSSIFIPDAFTPNNDGRNDVFRVGNLGSYRLVEMSVFNRWGNLVYHVKDGENSGWDGTYNGVPQDMGVYNYLIIVSKPDGTLENYKGTVTLLR